MCVNYTPTRREQIESRFKATAPDGDWQDDLWPDRLGPFIVQDDDGRRAILGNYGIKPKRLIPAGVKKFDTHNARFEDLLKRRNYVGPWRKSQLCLVPCIDFTEPNWESGKNEWWRIWTTDNQPFAIAGLWNSWEEEGGYQFSFTQLTINADDHPFMRRFHRVGHEKRSLVILPEQDWDDWLTCRDPEFARTFMQPYPAELMTGAPKSEPR